MITVEQFYSACKDIEKNLREIVGIETDTLSWIIQKIDFCYNWKLNSKTWSIQEKTGISTILL